MTEHEDERTPHSTPHFCSREEGEGERYHLPAGLSLMISRVNDGSSPYSGKGMGNVTQETWWRNLSYPISAQPIKEQLLERGRISQAGEIGRQDTGEIQEREKQGSAHKVEGAHAPGQAGGRLAEKQLGRKGPWGPAHTALNMSQGRAPAAQVASSLLGCVRRRATSRPWEGSLCTLLRRPRLECCVLYWAPQYRRNMDILEQVQRRTPKMTGGCHTSRKWET